MPKQQEKGGVILSALELDLLTVLRGEKELYGLKILEKVNEARSRVGINKLGVSSLYPTLKRMEQAYLIKGEYREHVAGSDSPRRKYYRLLNEGEIAISRTNAYRRLLEGKDNNSEVIPEGELAG